MLDKENIKAEQITNAYQLRKILLFLVVFPKKYHSSKEGE